MNRLENVCDFYSHFYDDAPINIVAVGESYWYNDTVIERSSSDLTAIEFVVSGYGILECNGKKYNLEPRDVFLLRKGTYHKYYNADDSTLYKIYITLSGELPEILLNQYLPGHNYVYHNLELEDLFKDILKKAKSYGDDYFELVKNLSPDLLKILIAISHCSSSQNNDLVTLLKEYLDTQIYSPFSLDSMCKKFGYSKNHLINIFSKRYKITPYQYYTSKKLETVKLYLLNTNFPLYDIAEKMSFSDQQYFSSWFKSLCGVSPSGFRNSFKKGNCDNSQ